MISLTETFAISANSLPYSYQFSSNGLDCITFSNASGTTSNPSLTTVIMSDSGACLNGAVITLTVTDNEGCSEAFNFTMQDPCNNFTLTDISHNGNLTFSVIGTSPGCNGLNFIWNYDESVYTQVGVSNNAFVSSITLALRPGIVPPETNNIGVESINCKGCKVAKTYSFSYCQPVAQNLTRALGCFPLPNSPGEFYHESTITLPELAGCASTAKWTTLIARTTSGLIVTHTGNNTLVVRSNGLAPGVYSILYSVEDGNGVRSNTAEILITVGLGCASNEGSSGVGLQNITQEVNFSGATAGDLIQIPLTNYVVKNSNKNIDWSSWTLNTSPAPLSSSIILKALVTGEQYIEYEVPTPVPDFDNFSWTIADEDGVYSSSSYVSLVQSGAAPVTVDDSACVVAGNSVNINVISNDTITRPVNNTGVNIVTPPTNGAVSVNQDKTIMFSTAREEKFLGGNAFTYSVTDVDGYTSNVSTVTVTVICAGDGQTKSLCYPYTVTNAVFAPIDYVSQPRTGSGTWTKMSVFGPAAPGVWNGNIDFSAVLSAGQAVYRYRVINGSCTDETFVTFNVEPHLVAPNDECATAQVFSFGGQNTNSIVGSQTNKAGCPGIQAVSLSVTTIPSSWNLGTYDSDLWYEFTAPPAPVYTTTPITYESYPITISVEGSPYGQDLGIKAPAVAVYSGNCGALVLEKAACVNQNKQNVTTTISFGTGSASRTFYVRVGCLDTFEGNFNLRVTGNAEFITNSFTNPNTFVA